MRGFKVSFGQIGSVVKLFSEHFLLSLCNENVPIACFLSKSFRLTVFLVLQATPSMKAIILTTLVLCAVVCDSNIQALSPGKHTVRFL